MKIIFAFIVDKICVFKFKKDWIHGDLNCK